MHVSLRATTAAIITLTCIACNSDPADAPMQDMPRSGTSMTGSRLSDEYVPAVTAADFVADVTNPRYPLSPGMRWIYESKTADGLERIEIDVLGETKQVWGVDARVVHDIARRDGEVIEDTIDWYAQDKDGNVWYLGEQSTSYKDGKVDSMKGSWEAGKDGALPGIAMLAQPMVGTKYRQEYLAGEAEDVGEVVGVDQQLELTTGSYQHCIETLDTTALEPDVVEHKHYCPGVGFVLETEGTERLDLIEFQPG